MSGFRIRVSFRIWEPHLSLDHVISLCLVLINQIWSLPVHLTAADHLIFSPTCPWRCLQSSFITLSNTFPHIFAFT